MEPDRLCAWFGARVPDDWYVAPPEVLADREEVLVVGEIAAPAAAHDPALADDEQQLALAAAIRAHRERTRDGRVALAAEAEALLGRKVAWGARCGGRTEVFTALSVPVMTRLRLPERQVLDTLIDAGVARSRSEALAWCVRLVGRHQGDWIAELRAAMEGLERARRRGPDV